LHDSVWLVAPFFENSTSFLTAVKFATVAKEDKASRSTYIMQTLYQKCKLLFL